MRYRRSYRYRWMHNAFLRRVALLVLLVPSLVIAGAQALFNAVVEVTTDTVRLW